MTEQQQASPREVSGRDESRSRQVVDADEGQVRLLAPCRQNVRVLVVAYVLVAIGHHRTAPVPSPAPDDVYLGGKEGVRVADDRADVEIVLPVLDADVERVAALVEVGHHGVPSPVAVAVDDVAPVTVSQEVVVEAGVVRPWLGMRSDPDVHVSILVAVAGVDWVAFDLGETLVDETELWGRWADYLGVPRLAFFAALGGVITERRPHTDVFGLLGFDLARLAESVVWEPGASDLYADALPTLISLRAAGYRLAIAGNQPLSTAPFLTSLPVDVCATSAEWGVSKPSPEFFARLAEMLGVPPERIAYVGDRVDNDVVPASRAGMVAIHIRRGPWGYLQAAWPEAEVAHARMDDLSSLPAVLDAL